MFLSICGHNAKSIRVPFSLYPCSKYAVTGMSESIRNEIINDGLNIRVTVSTFIFFFFFSIAMKFLACKRLDFKYTTKFV